MNKIVDTIKYTKKLNLLYVEDNNEARVATLKMLQEFFNEIVVGVDGLDGLEKFKENDIDLIITDIHMPKMNGLDMLHKIKEIDSQVIALVLSAYNEPEYFIQSIKIGVEGYILKPINLEQFIAIIRKSIQKIQAKKDKLLLEQYKEVVDASAIVSIIGIDNKLRYVNDSFCKLSGFTQEELIGHDYHFLMKGATDSSQYRKIWKKIKIKKETWKGIIKNYSKSGQVYYLDSTIKPILDTNEEVIEYIGLRHDITAIMNPLKRLNDLIDSLDIPMLILMKIEDYDNIESCYGLRLTQKIEELVSIELFNKLPQELDIKDIFSLGNGEYAICSERLTQGNKTITKILQNFQSLVNQSRFDMGEIDYDISIILSLSCGKDCLENAKYGIKQLLQTKQNFIFADNILEEEHINAQKNISILSMIKNAIENKKLVSYFQAIVDNKTKEIVKYESLVRIIDENDNAISPFAFLETSKKAKYYTQITSIVLDNTFEALQKTDKDISINLSTLDIEKAIIVEKFFKLFEDVKYASRLTIELLEDEDSKDFEVIKSFIVRAKKLGVKIAIDDFGSGYSNFGRLLEYQPDILKIDGSLIKNIVTDKFSYSIVKTIVTFAKEQNLEVIAEYVESREIYEVLCTLEVNFSQGYYFAKPEPLV